MEKIIITLKFQDLLDAGEMPVKLNRPPLSFQDVYDADCTGALVNDLRERLQIGSEIKHYGATFKIVEPTAIKRLHGCFDGEVATGLNAGDTNWNRPIHLEVVRAFAHEEIALKVYGSLATLNDWYGGKNKELSTEVRSIAKVLGI